MVTQTPKSKKTKAQKKARIARKRRKMARQLEEEYKKNPGIMHAEERMINNYLKSIGY